jgi:hypothetical protein
MGEIPTMKLKPKNKRMRTLEDLWAIEDEFPAVCGPNPVSYAARFGLKLSKSYLAHLGHRQTNGHPAKPAPRRLKRVTAAKNSGLSRLA